MRVKEYIDITLSNDHLKAYATLKKPLEGAVTKHEILTFLENSGVVYGIDYKQIDSFLLEDLSASSPVVIASGKKVIHGTPATVTAVVTLFEQGGENETQIMNLRNIHQLKNVESGTTVAKKVEATIGENGMTVSGQEIRATPGKDLTLRAGRHTRVNREQTELIATCSGKLSVEDHIVHVYPVHEVNGDISMKTGNIDFAGSVKVHGDVPAGYEINAKGDIIILGSVEGADLSSGGSIYVREGIVSQGKGSITAEVNVHTSFVNQATIFAGNDLIVAQSILHSNISVLGKVECTEQRGNIVGGSVSAAQGIKVNEAGNEMNTPTHLYLGVHKEVLIKEKEVSKMYEEAKQVMTKLSKLYRILIQKEQENSLLGKERLFIVKVKHNIVKTNKDFQEISEKKEKIHYVLQQPESIALHVQKGLNPNVNVYFGKYRRKILAKHHCVTLTLNKSEITLTSL
ncbi:DUF342 domain-containing protein [Alteribacter aurantiacus]|uniref:DUF342 domain-containing protein n=1 Tax=Alteribacter aurantiacus TaxID=254410 RepID=UPI0003F6CC3A|nr:FapA family protein [Alteribacter aurantiacus]